jgi:hypothetical protein
MSAGAAGGAAAAAAMQAKVAMGMLVRVAPDEFQRLVERQDNPLVVRAAKRKVLFFEIPWRYMTPYRGLAFWTQSPTPLSFRPEIEFVEAEQIYVP